MLGVVVVCVTVALVLGIAALTTLWWLSRRRVAATLTIDPDRGILERRFVRLGGVDQWIQIRGADRGNPILLLVGGAGLPMEPFTPGLLPWEREVTVVLWDRRDVGRTRGRNGKAGNESWTFEQFAEDGIELVGFLRSLLGQDKVILVGQSQGSIVAALMARRRPDLFHAYVGTGQIVDMARNERQTHRMALDRAREAANTKALKALQRHTPPYHEARSWIAKQRWSMATDPEMRAWQRKAPAIVLTWPTYGLADAYRAMLGVMFLPPRLFTATMECTPQRLGTTYDIPVFLLHGEDDVHTLPEPAEEYLAAIRAPAKEFVRLPGTGHLSLLARPELFLTELLARVRPLLQPSRSQSRTG
jgi:pimeloyl-ACP methyl ester carboxylesterase